MEEELLDDNIAERKQFGITQKLFSVVLAVTIILLLEQILTIYTAFNQEQASGIKNNFFVRLIFISSLLYTIKFRIQIYKTLDLKPLKVISIILIWITGFSLLFQELFIKSEVYPPSATMMRAEILSIAMWLTAFLEQFFILRANHKVIEEKFKYLRQYAIVNFLSYALILVLSLLPILFFSFESPADFASYTNVFVILSFTITSMPVIMLSRAAYKFITAPKIDESPSPAE